jgi:hypothetical protein
VHMRGSRAGRGSMGAGGRRQAAGGRFRVHKFVLTRLTRNLGGGCSPDGGAERGQMAGRGRGTVNRLLDGRQITELAAMILN